MVCAFIGKSRCKKEASQLINAKGPDATAKTGSVVASKKSIRNNEGIVNPEPTADLDVSADAKTESVAPFVLKSERTWKESDYVQARDKAAAEIAKAIGVTEQKAKDYIDSVKDSYSNFPVVQGIVDSFVEEYKTNHPEKLYSSREQNWKAKLDSTEWGIVNYAVENNQGSEITSTCNMFLKKTKGRTVFGIYSTEDSTLPYASRDQRAEEECIFVRELMEEYRNGKVIDTSAKGLRAWAKTVRMQRTANDYHGTGDVAPE